MTTKLTTKIHGAMFYIADELSISRVLFENDLPEVKHDTKTDYEGYYETHRHKVGIRIITKRTVGEESAHALDELVHLTTEDKYKNRPVKYFVSDMLFGDILSETFGYFGGKIYDSKRTEQTIDEWIGSAEKIDKKKADFVALGVRFKKDYFEEDIDITKMNDKEQEDLAKFAKEFLEKSTVIYNYIKKMNDELKGLSNKKSTKKDYINRKRRIKHHSQKLTNMLKWPLFSDIDDRLLEVTTHLLGYSLGEQLFNLYTKNPVEAKEIACDILQRPNQKLDKMYLDIYKRTNKK